MQVGAGQRINVTMYDYSYSAAMLRHADLQPRHSAGGSYPLPAPVPTPARTCRVFSTIREPARGATTTTVCDLRGRVVNVFTSDTERIELRVMTVPSRPDTASSSATSRSTSSSSSSRQPAAASRHDNDQPDTYVMFHYTGIVGITDSLDFISSVDSFYHCFNSLL